MCMREREREREIVTVPYYMIERECVHIKTKKDFCESHDRKALPPQGSLTQLTRTFFGS